MRAIEKFEEIVGINVDLFLIYSDKYKQYKARAKKNKIDFKLSFQQFYLAVTSGCYVCNLDGKTNEIGIDRLDNKEGYIYGNIGGCCWNCNRAKNSMSISEFSKWLERINPNHEIVSCNSKMKLLKDSIKKEMSK